MRFLSVWLLTFIVSFSFAQQRLQFDRFEQIEYLEKRSVISLVQDDYGFMWFGTHDGLIRYDGYELKHYKSNPKDKNSLSHNDIRALTKDAKGNLWIATQGGGLNKFNIRSEKFTHYLPVAGNPNTISGLAVWSVFVDSRGYIWAGTFSDGLNRLDPSTDEFKLVKEEKHFPIHCILEDDKGMIWFSSSGFNLLNPATLQLLNFPGEAADPKSLFTGDIRIALLKNDKIWFGTEESGFFQFDIASKNYESYKLPVKTATPSVFSLYQDNSGKLWVGTIDGLVILNGDGSYTLYQNTPSDKYSLSANPIRAIYCAIDETVWIGTEGAGVNKVMTKKKFKVFRESAAEGGLSHNLIRSIYKDAKGRLWVGTHGGGLNLLDEKKKSFEPIDVSAKSILYIYEDKDDTFWMGTWGGGLVHYSPQKGIIKVFRQGSSDEMLPDDRVQAILRDRKGVLWLGTENGLCQFDPLSGKCKLFEPPNFPKGIQGSNVQSQAFLESPDGSIWAGTWQGLNKISPDRQSVITYTADTTQAHHLSNEHIIALHHDEKNQVMWIGTFGGGLNRLDLKTGSIAYFTEDDGLANNIVFGIKEDADGNLWISTSNGLSRFNPRSKWFRNYNETDGLPSNEFYWGAAHKTREGEMLFGGVNGLTFFQPDAIKENTRAAPVAITNFLIFNKPVNIGGSDSPLQQSLFATKTIELSYKQSIFTFEFSALDYSNSKKNQYAYRLVGFDKDWSYVGTKRSATYTNINPGKYTFTVKAANNDGLWNNAGTSITLIIHPPFWMTWWFRGILTLLIGGGVLAFYINKINSINRQKRILEETVEARTAEVVKQKEELEVANREIKDSIRAAHVLQQAILPSTQLIQNHLPESFILNRPKDVVSGDFYWFDVIEDKIIIAVADCTGHGVSGAFMSINGHHLLNQAIYAQPNLAAAEILDRLNEGLLRSFSHNEGNTNISDGMDIALCIIDKQNKKLQFSGANCPLYILRQGEIIQVKANRFPIGFSLRGKINKYTNHEVSIQDGDAYYFFSDGYADQIGGPTGSEKFLYQSFRELLVKIGSTPMNQQLRELEDKHLSWRGQMEQLDDILVIGYRI